MKKKKYRGNRVLRKCFFLSILFVGKRGGENYSQTARMG
jgi:hypothetical protein